MITPTPTPIFSFDPSLVVIPIVTVSIVLGAIALGIWLAISKREGEED